MCLPVAVPSVTETSTTTSCDATLLIVMTTDNGLFSLATKYSDCSNDITMSVENKCLIKLGMCTYVHYSIYVYAYMLYTICFYHLTLQYICKSVTL